ncbi:MAG: hypothetical protein IPL72_11705 [Sulfuritalea sp.]|nr:hypothetical protein [Sulfuritalea sp.]
MSKLLSILIAAAFAAVSAGSFAASHAAAAKDDKKMDKKREKKKREERRREEGREEGKEEGREEGNEEVIPAFHEEKRAAARFFMPFAQTACSAKESPGKSPESQSVPAPSRAAPRLTTRDTGARPARHRAGRRQSPGVTAAPAAGNQRRQAARESQGQALAGPTLRPIRIDQRRTQDDVAGIAELTDRLLGFAFGAQVEVA